MPPQSAPPFLGSQSSRGSSTHLLPSLHCKAAKPPQKTGVTQMPGASHAMPHPGLYGSSTQICPLGHGFCWIRNPPQDWYVNVGCGVALVVVVVVDEHVDVVVAVFVGRFCSAGMAATSSEKSVVERRLETSIFAGWACFSRESRD